MKIIAGLYAIALLFAIYVPHMASALNTFENNVLNEMRSVWPDLNDIWVGPTPQCTWPGLTCQGMGGRLLELNITGRNLSNPIPSSIYNLTWLQVLILSGNIGPTGEIPQEFWSLNLTRLKLANTKLNGSISDNLANFSSLEQLELIDNQFTGTIPLIELPSTIQSVYVIISQNSNLTGPIPDTWEDLPSLTYLDLSQNNLSGAIPSSLFSNLALQTIKLYSNDLEGVIPSDIQNLAQLSLFDAHDNQLSGDFPAAFGSLPSLSTLSLYNNFMNFCNPSFTGFAQPLSVCTLTQDEGYSCGTGCPLFPGCSINTHQTSTCPAPPPVIAPPPITVAPVSPPFSAPVAAPSIECVGIAPIPSFICLNGVWVASGNVQVTSTLSLTAPAVIQGNLELSTGSKLSLSSTVQIEGDFQVGSGAEITFSNFDFSSKRVDGSTARVSVSGCAQIDSSIDIELSESEVDSLASSESSRSALLVESQTCNPGTPAIRVSSSSSDCRTVTASSRTSGSSPTTLSAVFEINSSACNKKRSDTWWIVLASVLGAVVLIVFAFVCIVLLFPSVKRSVMPFYTAHAPSGTTTRAHTPRVGQSQSIGSHEVIIFEEEAPVAKESKNKKRSPNSSKQNTPAQSPSSHQSNPLIVDYEYDTDDSQVITTSSSPS